MNKEETWALYQQGKDAWNAWAKERHAERTRLEEAGQWDGESIGRMRNQDTVSWLHDAKADFEDLVFKEEADFQGFLFPGEAQFHKTIFKQSARFDDAVFEGDAKFGEAEFNEVAWFYKTSFEGFSWFERADFRGAAWFERASFEQAAMFNDAKFHALARYSQVQFCGDAAFPSVAFSRYALFEGTNFLGEARFEGVTFRGDVRFEDVTFKSNALFSYANFETYTTFGNAVFKGQSDFGAIDVKRAFTLAGATFHQVPDFIQANFAQAPRLDDLDVKVSEVRHQVSDDDVSLPETKSDAEAKWRALKRLAIQAHDHARELDFFAGELKASRGVGTWKQIGVLIVSFPYEWLSDFGRSIGRPLFWFLVTLAVFYGVYLGNHSALVEREQWGSVWTLEKFTSYFDDREVPVDACEVGSEDSNAVNAAVALSLRNTIPFTGLGAPEKLNQVYRCLYGVEGAVTPGSDFPLERLPPRIPDRIAFYSVLQTLISAVLIFLFLLAVRNHFRIK